MREMVWTLQEVEVQTLKRGLHFIKGIVIDEEGHRIATDLLDVIEDWEQTEKGQKHG